MRPITIKDIESITKILDSQKIPEDRKVWIIGEPRPTRFSDFIKKHGYRNIPKITPSK